MSDERGRVLVVDDNADNLDMLSRRLRRRGYEVIPAENGRIALERAAAEHFDLVLLDIMMPDMDGLEVLTRLRAVRSAAELPVIMATAKDHSNDVVRALEMGANDYVTKPLDFPVVLARMRTQLALKRTNEALDSANRRMRLDLEAGAKVQRALIPSAPPSVRGVQIAWTFEPCAELGGDILDAFALDDEHLGLYLLDVSGHGVPAALLSVTVSRLLSHRGPGSLLVDGAGGPAAGAAHGSRDAGGLPSPGSTGAGGHRAGPATVTRPTPPAQVAAHLNQQFPMDPATSQYFTFLYGVLETGTRELRYVAAGHPGPLHIDAAGAARSLESTGLAIGWLPNARFEERSVRLARGDRIYFFSDWVTEAQNAEEELFGMERFAELLERARDVTLERSLEELQIRLRQWCGAAAPGDDVSVLAVEITG